MHHWRCAYAFLNDGRVAAVSVRAFTVEADERADLAVGGIMPKRARTAWRCAAAPRPKRRMIGAVLAAADVDVPVVVEHQAPVALELGGGGRKKVAAHPRHCSAAAAQRTRPRLRFE